MIWIENRARALCRLLGPVAGVALLATVSHAQAPPTRAETLETMRRATEFMVEEVSTRGGYVWSYLPDFSRRWGEMEAKETMIWVQPPGTATMGHLFLDAYHATGDEYYYESAEKAANALIWGQHPGGGWNYLIDFGGEGSIRDWYETIGKSGWRLEEFQHYYGNATFDDAGTSEASQLLLRLYLEKLDPRYRPALNRAIDFVLESQYPIGGWPQRYPLRNEFSKKGRPDYTSFITFNDDVAAENIEFLIRVYQTMGDPRALDAIHRAMSSVLVTQQGQPQPGWALQYTTDLQPAGARTYEPLSLSPPTTAQNVEQLMKFYRLTGDTKYLARIPEALDWLNRVRLAPGIVDNGDTHPTFVEIGTDRPLFVHRRGSNVFNGEYYVDYDPRNTVGHYSSTRTLDVDGLRDRFERLRAISPEEATRGSPLRETRLVPLPEYFIAPELDVADLNTRALDDASGTLARRAAELVAGLDSRGYWPTRLTATSNPYAGDGPATPPPGDYSTTRVGDYSDTSPYEAADPPVGISTGAYIRNMSTLIRYLDTLE